MASPRAVPRWIIPVNLPTGTELRSLSAVENGVRKYIFKEDMPRPDVVCNEYWIWNTIDEKWHSNGMTQLYISALLKLIPIIKARFGKISLFGEDEGFYSVNFHRERNYREGNRIYICNPAILLENQIELNRLLRTDEELEAEQWQEMENKFNDFIDTAKEDLEQNKRRSYEKLRLIDKSRMSLIKEIELLERTTFDSTRVSLKSEIEKIKQLKEVRKLYLSGGMITIETQPVVTGYKTHQYFMGEYKIQFLDGLPDIENMSYTLSSGHFHPHISPDRVCFGNFDTVFNELIKKRDYVNVVRYCMSFIQKYNPSSPFKEIELFPIWEGTTSKILSPSSINWKKKYPQWGIV